MTKLSFTTFLLFLFIVAKSQTVENFTGLRAYGPIPSDFTILSTDKYKQDYKENTDTKLDQEFFLNTRFFIDELLLSGKIIFNDPLSNYITQVAKVVLGENDSLFNSLRFYTVRTNVANAFATDQGIIFVTTGLLAQLENEAQLAFILAHEISHYTSKHVRRGYLERKKIENQGRYGQVSYDEVLKNLSTYNKSNELEADAKGISLFLETDYLKSQVLTAFEVLLYSQLPFGELPFDSTYFNSELLKIPGLYFPDKATEITIEDNADDSLSTHPNIKTRTEKAQVYLKPNRFKTGDKKFIVSEEVFYQVRNLSRFELIHLNLAERRYGEALYEIYLLKKDFPSNRFLDLSQVKALYGLVKYKNHSRYDEVTKQPKEIEGQSSILHGFLSAINKQQLNVIALRNVYDITQKYPEDSTFIDYLQDLKKEFALNSNFKLADLKSTTYSEHLIELDSNKIQFDIEDSILKTQESDLPKTEKFQLIDKLKELKANQNITYDPDKDFIFYALCDLVKNENLVEELVQIKKDAQANLTSTTVSVNSHSDKKNKTNLGIKKLIVVDPIYENYGLNKERKLVKSENKKVKISSYYETGYNKLDLETTLLDSKNLDSSQVDKYNEMAQIYTWLLETLHHEDLDMISSSHEEMSKISTKHETPHFLFTGIYGYNERSKFRDNWILLVTIYAAPIGLIDMLIIHNYFEFVAIEINAETDEVEFVQIEEVNLKSINTVLDAYIYKLLYQLSSKKKK